MLKKVAHSPEFEHVCRALRRDAKRLIESDGHQILKNGLAKHVGIHDLLVHRSSEQANAAIVA